MFQKHTLRIIVIIISFIFMLGAVNAFAASNTFTSNSRLIEENTAITINDLRPPACAALALENIVVCSHNVCNGTNANDLILGDGTNSTINGKKGDDCIVAGAGGVNISGDNGTDVCLGGPDADNFDSSCEEQRQDP
jgi:Ca2+-binding RTX toxin-like protein